MSAPVRKILARTTRQDEEGIALLELVGALTILAVGFLALAASMGLGFRQVALARQRQSASEIGSGRIEHLRNVPYDNVSLSTQPVHSNDVTNPDYFVNTPAGDQFDYSGQGTWEPLIIDTAVGQVEHLENPVQVGNTSLSVYQYVTWVDDPAITGTQDYKRVTVVVVYNSPSVQGISKMVRTSSFFTIGNVTISGAAPGPQQGTAAPSPSATASPTPTGSCEGDTTGPAGDFSIQSGTGSETGYTNSLTVTLFFAGVSDPCGPIVLSFSNDGTTYGIGVIYDETNPAVSWTLDAGEGSKSVWGRIVDGVGNATFVGPYSITVDTTKPTVPGTLSRTVSCQGNDRTVNLSWGSSTDTNFRGYRIYKSVNSGAWVALGTVSGTIRSDTDSKLYDSLRYAIVAYDKAGNESNATNIVSLSKNQCS